VPIGQLSFYCFVSTVAVTIKASVLLFLCHLQKYSYTYPQPSNMDGKPGLGLSALAFLLIVIGLAIPYWMYGGVTTFYFGLWKTCIAAGDTTLCTDFENVCKYQCNEVFLHFFVFCHRYCLCL